MKKILLFFAILFMCLKVVAQCCDYSYNISKEEYQNITVDALTSLFNCPQISLINSCFNNDTFFIHTLSPILDSLIQLRNPKLIIKHQYPAENTWFCSDFMLDPHPNPINGKYEKATIILAFRTKSKELMIGITLEYEEDNWEVMGFNIYSVR
ncbi:MAG: hypothetical protein ACOXZH_04165 [Bacteroidales bacterium]|jgi:hypothetical protein